MNFAMTGTGGLIGTTLKKRLLKKGDKCNLEIDLRKGSNILNINDYGINMKTQPIDIFYHLGASCRINECIKNPRLSHYNNAEGTFQALEFCKKNDIKKFVYFSSSRTLSKEENPYTASKKYGENLCKAYKDCFDIEHIIVRPSTVYSEGHDLTTRLLTKWVINAMTDKPLILYGDENKTLDFTHVDDFVDGIELLVNQWDKTKNDAYDICGDDQRKLVDVGRIISDEVQQRVYMDFQPAEKAQPQNIKIDISKMRRFDYNPKIKIEEGIRRLVNFYKTEGRKWIN
ncbi:MAG: NAD-dependent epimerase/dehydratase family protein [Candidatus Aenigmarchaeota archaeon]|nr:NAD-dependent epimerase/dehydratase family protein [Candidatus Aenigmarchaeota archaeon]